MSSFLSSLKKKKKPFRSSSARESSSEFFQERETLPAFSLVCWRRGTRSPATASRPGEGGGLGLQHQRQRADARAHTSLSPVRKACGKNPSSFLCAGDSPFSLGTEIKRGLLLEGWGEEAGPEDSEGEDRNRLWFASAWTPRGHCLDGDGGISPLEKPLWSLSTGSKGRGKASGLQRCLVEHPPQHKATLFLAVSLVHAVFFHTA